MIITSPRKLQNSDQRSDFCSGADDLDEWLKKYARQNQTANSATTYVATDGSRVIGYYAIAMSAVEMISAPAELRKSMPRQIPCMLLARLAVDQQFKGQGLGAALLRDALLRALSLSKTIGAAAVLVHCRDENAKRFYLNNGDFLISPMDDMQLMVSTKALSRLVEQR